MAEDNRYLIPEPTFKSTTDDLLYALLMGGICIGREDLAVTQGADTVLTPPAGAKYAIIQVEANDAIEDDQKAIIYTQDGTTPDGTSTPKVGQMIPHIGYFEIKGTNNLASVIFRSVENLTNYLHVEYFK